MMPSEARQKAGSINGKKSCGKKTATGKQRSAQNARKHGLRSKTADEKSMSDDSHTTMENLIRSLRQMYDLSSTFAVKRATQAVHYILQLDKVIEYSGWLDEYSRSIRNEQPDKALKNALISCGLNYDLICRYNKSLLNSYRQCLMDLREFKLKK